MAQWNLLNPGCPCCDEGCCDGTSPDVMYLTFAFPSDIDCTICSTIAATTYTLTRSELLSCTWLETAGAGANCADESCPPLIPGSDTETWRIIRWGFTVHISGTTITVTLALLGYYGFCIPSPTDDDATHSKIWTWTGTIANCCDEITLTDPVVSVGEGYELLDICADDVDVTVDPFCECQCCTREDLAEIELTIFDDSETLLGTITLTQDEDGCNWTGEATLGPFTCDSSTTMLHVTATLTCPQGGDSSSDYMLTVVFNADCTDNSGYVIEAPEPGAFCGAAGGDDMDIDFLGPAPGGGGAISPGVDSYCGCPEWSTLRYHLTNV